MQNLIIAITQAIAVAMELTEGSYRGKSILNKRERIILQIMMECMKNQNQYQG